jgi:hypothetical protein
MSGRTPKFQFTGTIQMSYDPVLKRETYTQILTHEKSGEWPCFSQLKFSSRAEGGFYRATYRIYGERTFLEEMFFNGLGRHVVIYDNAGLVVWEGKNFEMNLVIKNIKASISIKEEYNNVWMRYRINGGTTTAESTAQADAASQARYGKRDYVLSGGELDSSTIADQISTRVLALNRTCKPIITPNTNVQETEPYIEIIACGYFDTLTWQVYAQTAATGSQAASSEVTDIITAKGQYVASSNIIGNGTSVSKVYNIARKAGDIIQDIARLGDPSGNRWLPYMLKDRTFYYGPAVAPVLPSSAAGGGNVTYETSSITNPGGTSAGPLTATAITVGTNPYRAVFVGIGTIKTGATPSTVTSVTFGGIACTRIDSDYTYTLSGVSYCVSWWRLLNPTGGSQSAVVNLSTTVNGNGCFINTLSYFNVNQSNPINNFVHVSSTANPLSTNIAAQVGTLVLDMYLLDWTSGPATVTPDASQTKHTQLIATGSSGTSDKPGANSVTMIWTPNAGSVFRWGHYILAINAVLPVANRAIAYYYDIWHPDHPITDAQGNIIPPWLIRANNWIQITGLSLPTMKQTSTFVDDPTLFYIEECEYQDGADLPALKNNRAQLLDVALSRLAARSSV